MIMADDDAEDADVGGLELLGGTRPPLRLLPPREPALLLFDRLSCLLFLFFFFLPEAVLPNDATELEDDIRRIPGIVVAGLSAIYWGLCYAPGRERERVESNRIGSNCNCRNFP